MHSPEKVVRCAQRTPPGTAQGCENEGVVHGHDDTGGRTKRTDVLEVRTSYSPAAMSRGISYPSRA